MNKKTQPILGFIAYQAAWFACVLLAREGFPWAGSAAMITYAAAHLALDWEKRSGELAPIALCAIYGFSTDSLLTLAELISFAQPTPPIGPSPMWMVALWVGFGATLNHSLSWLGNNYRISAVVGIFIGPLAYAGGEGMDLLSFGNEPMWTYAALALQWAIALTLLPAAAAASRSLEWNAATVLRRTFTLTQFSILWVISTLGSPLFIALTLSADIFRYLTRKVPMTATRCFATIYVYLFGEVWGMISLFWVWIRCAGDEDELLKRSTHIQTLWASGLFAALCRIFQLTVRFEGAERCAPGPIIVMVRHCSHLDTLLPTSFITKPEGIRLNFVIKKELIWDPCIDIAGQRLNNHFVDRKSSDRAAETQSIAALADNLGPMEGVMIFPEGTRFTEKRKARALERIKESRPDLYERAASLKNLLPIRPAGSLALLEAGADIVIIGHSGLDALTTWAQLWKGDLVRKEIQIKVWRTKHSEIPEGEEARIHWLYDQWDQVDSWLSELSIEDHEHA